MEFIAVFHTMQDLSRIGDRVNKVMADDINICKDLIPYLRKAEIKQNYIKPETLNKHIAGLTAKRTENDRAICKLVSLCLSANLLPNDIHDTFLKNVLGFLKNEQSHVCYKFWLDNIQGCMKIDGQGIQLIQWLKQSFNSAVFTNRTSVQWKEALVSMLKIMEECFILGDNSFWQSITKVYDLNDDLGLLANRSLKQIVNCTEPDKWNFLDSVISKTSSMSITDAYFVVLGSILKKVAGQDIVKNKPALLKNWLLFVVAKKEVGDNEKQILKRYCKDDAFNELCKENLGLAKDLFKKGIEYL